MKRAHRNWILAAAAALIALDMVAMYPHVNPSVPQTQASFPLFTLGVVAIAIFDTALYLRTGANLLLAILVHLMANICGGIAAHGQTLNFFFVAEGLAAAVVVLLGGLR